MKKLTPEIVEDRIKKLLIDNNTIEYLGLLTKCWGDSIRKMKAKFFCKIHKEEFILEYQQIFGKDKIKCPKCNSEIRYKNHSKKLKKNNQKTAINKILKFFKNQTHLGLISIGEEGSNKYEGIYTPILLRCKKHNIYFYSRYREITKQKYLNGISKFHCPECMREEFQQRTPIWRLMKETEGIDIINTYLPNTVSFLGWCGDWHGLNTRVKLFCRKHGKEFDMALVSFIKCKKNKKFCLCSDCFAEKTYTKSEAIKKIKEVISYKNKNFGLKLEFLGFVDNKWIGTYTKLILKCNIHDSIQDTTMFSAFIKDKVLGCNKCSNDNSISYPEKQCGILLKKYLGGEVKIDSQHLFKVYDKVCKVNRKIYTDFYIEKLNLVVEYDGEQHFEFCKYIHHNYKDFIKQVNRDNCLNQYCKEQGINLLRISFKDRDKLDDIIKKYILYKKDITTKIQPKLLPIKYEEDKKWMLPF